MKKNELQDESGSTLNRRPEEVVAVTLNDFLVGLSKQVSNHNAKMMLQSAVLTSGIHRDPFSQLEKNEAEAICMALINRGGPAFQVGTTIYHKLNISASEH